MPKLFINNREINVQENTTLLEAAESMGLSIPTLCYLKNYSHFTSCMLCVVLDKKNNSLVPACSMIAEEGMEIETEGHKIKTARKDTIDMLLSEHVGDCEATCTIGCPANMDIPLMIRQIKEMKFDEAIKSVKNDIALPAILGRICSAPCENACYHKLYDTPVSICELKRIVADLDLEKENPYTPEIEKLTDKKIAVIGAGPTGLSTSYYLQRLGHQVTLYDKFEKPGGMMQYGVPAERLDKAVLANEIKQILRLGIQFIGKSELGGNLNLDELINNYDAVVLAIGTIDKENIKLPGLELSYKGVAVDKKTFQSNIGKVFAGGNTIRSGRSTIRSCAHGKLMAQSVHAYLLGSEPNLVDKRFNSTIGRIKKEEIPELIKGSEPHQRILPEGGKKTGYTIPESIKESERCFRCDCRKKNNCKLRDYADLFQGNQKRYKITDRIKFKKIIQHDNVIYEPGKCIKCNICVQITEKAEENLGLTMINRGFDITIAVPFNDSFSNGLKKVSKEVVENCPTAALSFINEI
ncbi:MAG: FAD-dependent oxidoreductase [Melioribacteraceae bacterium]|nr:FAD-dependent oxidoreductase [Melioribacteraceae bacterium]